MKWHYTTIHFEALIELGLSALEYIISDIIYHQSVAGSEWWAYSPSEIAELLGLDESTVRRTVARCVEKGTVNKDSDKVISSQEYINVVYPRNGRNARLYGRNAHLEESQTGETPAHLNYIGKKNILPEGKVYESEFEEKKKGKRIDSHILEVYRIVGGPTYPRPWEKIIAYRDSADWLYKEKGIEQIEKAMGFARENKSVPFLAKIHTPFDLFTKWEKLLDAKERV